MWTKLAFTVQKLPACEVRISPNFSQVLWSCSVLWVLLLQESCRDEFSPLPAEPKLRMDMLSVHWLDAQALLAGQGECQHFGNFLGKHSFRFLSSLAFKTPWPLEEPQIRQVALAQVARCLSAHKGELLDQKPFRVVPEQLRGLGQLRHWEQQPLTAAPALFWCRFCRGVAGAYIISSNEVPGVLLWLAHSASLELYSMCCVTPGNRGFVLTCWKNVLLFLFTISPYDLSILSPS